MQENFNTSTCETGNGVRSQRRGLGKSGPMAFPRKLAFASRASVFVRVYQESKQIQHLRRRSEELPYKEEHKWYAPLEPTWHQSR